MSFLHRAARAGSYLITLLLALVWTASALAALTHPIYDLGRPHVGDVIMKVGRALALAPEDILTLAHLLAGLELFIGVYLLATVWVAALEWVRDNEVDDAMLDVGLMMSAIGSLIGGLPLAGLGGEFLQRLIGELMLAAIASALAIYGRGYIVPEEAPPLQRRFDTTALPSAF